MNMNIMKTIGISVAMCMMSISLVDMLLLLRYSMGFYDVTDLAKEFMKPILIFSVALHFIINASVMKKPLHYILSIVNFCLIGVGYFSGIFYLATASDHVVSNIINKTWLQFNNSIFSLPVLQDDVENARVQILCFCLVMSLTMFSLAITAACNLLSEKRTSKLNNSKNVLKFSV